MRPNKMKQIWREGRWISMGWLSVSHGFTAEIMARQGFDALVVDMQHGLTDMNDVWPMLQAISQTETVPVVRVPWNDPPTIMKALVEKRLAGAALDVWEQEPIAADNPLLRMDNVIATPHAAYFSTAAVAQVPRRCGEELARALTGRRPLNVVNPEVYAPGAVRRAR